MLSSNEALKELKTWLFLLTNLMRVSVYCPFFKNLKLVIADAIISRWNVIADVTTVIVTSQWPGGKDYYADERLNMQVI